MNGREKRKEKGKRKRRAYSYNMEAVGENEGAVETVMSDLNEVMK